MLNYIVVTIGVVLICALVYSFFKKTPKIYFIIPTIVLAILCNWGVYSVRSSIKEDNTDFSSALQSLERENFISEIQENSSILKASITNQDFLYIAIINDGLDKTPMATYYCRLAKSKNIYLSAVKIIDIQGSTFAEGQVSGNELGKSFCN